MSPSRLARTLPLLATACAVEAGSCGGSHPTAQVPPAASSGVVAATSVAPSSSIATPVDSPVSHAAFDPQKVAALVAAPAFSEVKKQLDHRDYKAAADALQGVIDGKKVAADDADRAWFLLGRLRTQSKDDDAAERAYANVAEAYPLYAYAAARRAGILARNGKADDALALLSKGEDLATLAADRDFARADALAAKGDHEGAAKAFSLEKKSGRWVDASIRYAEEVAAWGVAAASYALEAGQAARRVRFETPLSTLVPRAEAAEKACKALLSAKDAAALGAPTPQEELQRANALLDAGKIKDAIAVGKSVVASLGAQKGKEPWCKALLFVAKAEERTKEKSKASDDYGAVADKCTDDSRVTALYDGAKLADKLKEPDVARARFAKVESLYPKHRLADDARLRAATIAIDQGDVAKGEAMLSSLPDDYPSGDMRSEALFRLALSRMKKGDWKGAAPFLARSLELVPKEDGYFVAGRAKYFLGRAKIEGGDAEAGWKLLEEVVREEPLTFSAAMAYARIAAKSAADAKSVSSIVDAAIAAEEEGALFGDRPELSTPSFARAVELARVGEIDASRRELAAAGLLKDASSDPEGQWVAAALFDAVGEARAAHSIARGKVTDWTHHYPGGKWRKAWELAYPRPWSEIVADAAKKQGIPTSLVWGVMREESAFDPEAVSPSAAYGLLQLILPTAATYAKPLALPSDAKSLSYPEVNIPIGSAFLAKLRTDFADHPSLAVPSYNAGEGATKRWMNPPLAPSFDLWAESVPYEETRKYTKRVLMSYWAYVALYDRASLDAELRIAAGK